jgi:hypothetical protein
MLVVVVMGQIDVRSDGGGGVHSVSSPREPRELAVRVNVCCEDVTERRILEDAAHGH